MTNQIMALAYSYGNALATSATDTKEARATLEAEIDRVSKDAARYQWLTTTGGGIGMRLAEVEKEWNGCDGMDGFNAALERCRAKRMK